MLPGNPNGMIFLKVVTEDGATKTIRCEPSTTIAEIKEQFSYRFNPDEHRICFADGRVGDENTSISVYGVEQNAFIYLRNKNLTQRRASAGPRPAWADTGVQSTVIGEKPVLDAEPGESEKTRISKLRNFISHFLKRRPSPQQLVDAKILNEAPVTATNKQPNFEDIQRCIEWIRKYAMHTEGVFRVSGSAQDNTAFADKLVNHKLDIEQFTPEQLSPHAVTTGLKIYMREKTAPVIPYKYYKEYMENYRRGNKTAEAVRQNCQHMISTLPENNRRILVMLCKFLKDLAVFESENKMNPHNLGVVFGPTLMRTESTGLESLTECDSQIAVVEELIVHINEVDLSAVIPPESVPSACGSAAATKKPMGGAAGGPKPGLKSSSSAALTPPPMLTIPAGGRMLKSTAAGPADAKKPAGPNSPTQQLTSPKTAAPAPGVPSPTLQGPPTSASPKPPGAMALGPASPTSNPPPMQLPPGSRPPVGAAPTPGKPPMGHAPVPSAVAAPQPTGSKLKLVPKFKVNVRGASAATVPQPQTPTGDEPSSPIPDVIQQEIVAALSTPNDIQKTKAAAAQLSTMFESNPRDATEMFTADIGNAAGFILLLGRNIAMSN